MSTTTRTNPSIRPSHAFGAGHDTDDVLGHARAHMFMPVWTLLRHIVDTDASGHLAVARLTLGIVMLPHALQKTFGWFGGPGFVGAYHGLAGRGLPGAIVILVIVGELLGSLALIFGALTRVGAAAIMIILLGAIATVNAPNGFFMNWLGAKAGEGVEYHLLALGLGLVCLLGGGGKLSIDRLILQWRAANGGSVSPVLMNEA